MDIKVGSRLKCSLTGSEFMVVKTGEGTLSNGAKNLLNSTEKTEISSDTKIEGPVGFTRFQELHINWDQQQNHLSHQQ